MKRVINFVLSQVGYVFVLPYIHGYIRGYMTDQPNAGTEALSLSLSHHVVWT